MVREEDSKYMQQAIALAERGRGFTNPNPLVGALIVKDGRVIAEGWHERYGGWHAERNAFLHCEESPDWATLYVTLEPCCHYGKTPPCTDVIIEHKIARVVVGMLDPNPLVAGQGIDLLKVAGMEVVVGVEEERVREQNSVFLKYITTGLPWVVLKSAMTLDGKIATGTGDSKWVTGDEARREVQEMRANCMGIMVGIGTVEADDPMLNCRIEDREVRQPIRIVVDSRARIALDSQLVKSARSFRTIVAHTCAAGEAELAALREQGVETLQCETCDGKVDVRDLVGKLGALKIDSILLEGGGNLNFSFLKAGLIDDVRVFVAPKLLGGKEAKTAVEGEGFCRMADAVMLKMQGVRFLGQDILLTYKVEK